MINMNSLVIIIYFQIRFTPDKMMNCGFCNSDKLIFHIEGVTCLSCNRNCGDIGYDTVSPSDYIESDFLRANTTECLLEMISRNCIPRNLVRGVELLLEKTCRIFKTVSRTNLTLISIYQIYREQRIFTSLDKLKDFYPTEASVTMLNNLHFKMVEKKIFKNTNNFTKFEIMNSLVEYFRISHADVMIIKEYISKIQNILISTQPVHIIAATCCYLISNNMISIKTPIGDIISYLSVRKTTISAKFRLIRCELPEIY